MSESSWFKPLPTRLRSPERWRTVRHRNAIKNQTIREVVMATAGIVVCSPYGMTCTECNELVIAPKSSARVSNHEVRHFWSCATNLSSQIIEAARLMARASTAVLKENEMIACSVASRRRGLVRIDTSDVCDAAPNEVAK
jgi:hypothetical protein